MDDAKRNTKEKKKLFIQALEKNAGNISTSCKAIGICRYTFYDWCEKDENFKKQVDEVNESLIDFAETQLMKKIKDGDTTSLIFFLKTKGKHRGYSEREIEVNVNNEAQVIYQVGFVEDD